MSYEAETAAVFPDSLLCLWAGEARQQASSDSAQANPAQIDNLLKVSIDAYLRIAEYTSISFSHLQSWFSAWLFGVELTDQFRGLVGVICLPSCLKHCRWILGNFLNSADSNPDSGKLKVVQMGKCDNLSGGGVFEKHVHQ